MLRFSKITLKPSYRSMHHDNEPVQGSVQHTTSVKRSVNLGALSCQSRQNEASQGEGNSPQVNCMEKSGSVAPSSPPLLSLSPPSWVNNFRDVYNEDRHFAKHWFWDNFDWDRQSLWIGKFNKTNNLPDNNEQIDNFLHGLVKDLNQHPDIRSEVYIKFYFSRNIKTNEPQINYLLICNSPQLPESFLGTLVNITFERYQLTEKIINKDKDFKRMLNHYLNWSNFYIYYNLMEELQY